MSAIISDKTMMKEILKATGFDCPQGMENLTFEQATSGGGGANTATCTLTVGTGYYQTNIDKEDFDNGSNTSLYGGWKLNSVSGSSGFFDHKEDAKITTNDSRISALFNGDSLSIKYEPTTSVEEGTIVTVTIEWTEASGGGSEFGKLQKVYAWFFYQYKTSIYTFTRNPKVGDMAFSIAQSEGPVSFVKIIGINTDDSGNVQSINTNSLTGYGYYGEAMLFDGYSIKERNGYPQGFVNADNGTIRVNLTFSKADIEPSEHATVNKWQVNGIDSNLYAYAETTDDLFIGRKVFIVNKDNVAIGDFAHFDDLEAFDVINTDNPYYVFYGDTNTLPKTVQLISATITNAQDYIGMIDGTCVINLTITE